MLNYFVRTLILILSTLLLLNTANGHFSNEAKTFENYLNNIKTLKAEFTQVSSNGQALKGTIYINRPGKMRLEYAPPSSLVIIADGKWLTQYDKELEDRSFVSLESTPAAILLQKRISFSGDIELTNINQGPGNSILISLARASEPEAGFITLIFDNKPMALRAWSIVDAQGNETRVNLSKIELNGNLDPRLFDDWKFSQSQTFFH